MHEPKAQWPELIPVSLARSMLKSIASLPWTCCWSIAGLPDTPVCCLYPFIYLGDSRSRCFKTALPHMPPQWSVGCGLYSFTCFYSFTHHLRTIPNFNLQGLKYQMITCDSTTKEVYLNENTTFILGDQQWTLVRAITFNLRHNFKVLSKWGCKLEQMSLMKGSWWVLEALRNFQEFVAVGEYFFAAPRDKHNVIFHLQTQKLQSFIITNILSIHFHSN